MKYISFRILPQGKDIQLKIDGNKRPILISIEDFDIIRDYSVWARLYPVAAQRGVGRGVKFHYLHRIVAKRMGLKGGEIDHINRDKYDARRCNLRAVSHAVNCRNRGDEPTRKNAAGVKHVRLCKSKGGVVRFIATLVCANRRRLSVHCRTLKEARRQAKILVKKRKEIDGYC